MKELKDICQGLEYGITLKELGVKQDSLFYWTGIDIDGIQPSIVKGGLDNLTCCSAFTTDELLEMLPYTYYKANLLTHKKEEYCRNLDMWDSEHRGQYYFYSGSDVANNDCNFTDKKLCNTLAKMLIYLIENKLMEAK